MGYFKEFEQSCTVFNPTFNTNNDTVNYPLTADATINLHIIRITGDEVDFSAETVAEYEVNPDGDQTAVIKKNAKIVDASGQKYKVTDAGEYLPLAKVTKFKLVRMINKTNV